MKQLTAALEAAYTEAVGTGAKPPSPEEVTTTWPGSPLASIRGTNSLTPIPTPKTFTPKHQRQSLGSCCQGRPPPPEVTPALRNNRLHAPRSVNTRSARAVVESSSDTSLTTAVTDPPAPAAARLRSCAAVCSSTGSSMSAMAGQPWAWGGVGAWKLLRNHAATGSANRLSGSGESSRATVLHPTHGV